MLKCCFGLVVWDSKGALKYITIPFIGVSNRNPNHQAPKKPTINHRLIQINPPKKFTGSKPTASFLIQPNLHFVEPPFGPTYSIDSAKKLRSSTSEQIQGFKARRIRGLKTHPNGIARIDHQPKPSIGT